MNPMVWDSLASLGGLAGVAALITAAATAVAQLRGLRRVQDDTKELKPDHGSSVADQIAHQGEKIDLILKMQSQTAESADRTHELISDRMHMHDIELRDLKKELRDLKQKME